MEEYLHKAIVEEKTDNGSTDALLIWDRGLNNGFHGVEDSGAWLGVEVLGELRCGAAEEKEHEDCRDDGGRHRRLVLWTSAVHGSLSVWLPNVRSVAFVGMILDWMKMGGGGVTNLKGQQIETPPTWWVRFLFCCRSYQCCAFRCPPLRSLLRRHKIGRPLAPWPYVFVQRYDPSTKISLSLSQVHGMIYWSIMLQYRMTSKLMKYQESKPEFPIRNVPIEGLKSSGQSSSKGLPWGFSSGLEYSRSVAQPTINFSGLNIDNNFKLYGLWRRPVPEV